jgi:hypothetical protein
MDRRTFVKFAGAAPAAAATLTMTTADGQSEPFDVNVLRLCPGDVLVITAAHHISQDCAERLKALVEEQLSSLDVRAWVMGDGLKVDGVLRKS